LQVARDLESVLAVDTGYISQALILAFPAAFALRCGDTNDPHRVIKDEYLNVQYLSVESSV
jgi:hypothetical protein